MAIRMQSGQHVFAARQRFEKGFVVEESFRQFQITLIAEGFIGQEKIFGKRVMFIVRIRRIFMGSRGLAPKRDNADSHWPSPCPGPNPARSYHPPISAPGAGWPAVWRYTFKIRSLSSSR